MRYFVVALICLLLTVGTLAASAIPQSGLFVSPYGSPSGDGSPEYPLDLSSVLASSSPLQAGQTAWLMGGTYTGNFRADRADITVRALPGNRVTIDGSVAIYGAGTTWRDLEVMNSTTQRTSAYSGSHPPDILQLDGFGVYAPRTRLINNVIHDTRQGVGFWAAGADSELYGNIIYNNGWMAPGNSGHGHGAYTQNREGWKTITDNFFLPNFDKGLIVYGGGGGWIRGVRMVGNVHVGTRWLVGAESPMWDIVADRNYGYETQSTFGYSDLNNGDLTLTNSYLATNAIQPLQVTYWQTATVTGNTIIGGAANTGYFVVFLDGPGGRLTYTWDNNDYRHLGPAKPFVRHGIGSYQFAPWQAATGFDAASTYSRALPTQNMVTVQPNAYQPGRAHVIIYNWEDLANVAVDLSGAGLTVGRRYILRNAQNYYAETTEFVYSGSPLSISMTGWTRALPIGWPVPLGVDTFPRFGAFVIEAG